jgi:uncharacterized repeat protein (TIGR03803 family)
VENVLYTFTGAGGDGIIPAGNLVFGTNGTLFGTTLLGGQNGNGTVYELTPPTQGGVWTESVIYSFSPGAGDGANPVAALVLDGAGAVYGVTQSGGVESCGNASNGCGTAFKLVPPSTGGGAWTEEILHAFLGSGDGDVPQASLAIVGNTVYGTTMLGGTGFCNGTGGQLGCGTVFQVSQ